MVNAIFNADASDFTKSKHASFLKIIPNDIREYSAIFLFANFSQLEIHVSLIGEICTLDRLGNNNN